MDVERLADGLWRWTTAEAGCVYYEAPDAVVLFDPLLPAGEEEDFFAYLDRDVERLGLPVSILLTAARHERSAPILRERYGADDRVPATVEVYPVAAAARLLHPAAPRARRGGARRLSLRRAPALGSSSCSSPS